MAQVTAQLPLPTFQTSEVYQGEPFPTTVTTTIAAVVISAPPEEVAQSLAEEPKVDQPTVATPVKSPLQVIVEDVLN